MSTNVELRFRYGRDWRAAVAEMPVRPAFVAEIELEGRTHYVAVHDCWREDEFTLQISGRVLDPSLDLRLAMRR